ncbi:uncharacterized protein LOC114328034 [Diabrotica virgifera virgifera]|uniref:Uncharacterized protein LOC114328034 n=1 Tax=Diabrotica virgifera virgifera TaxID=50390 RepID=A0A6P7FH87_DIAVI|nr:uncharacterized protein LOC114328034 [Diabrotica virgifera virgifera]
MAFILPDNILETLLCSFCHKYLSVKPVKVYPNRLIQCGRCVDNEEPSIQKSEGVESLYGMIAQNILFKCVNRFDGCRRLLAYSQVRDHEQVCWAKIHECPICNENMASLMMLPHFRSNHKDVILDYPAFVFELNDDDIEMPSVYLYQEDDNLFFLYISYRKSENTIRLDLEYTGNSKLAKNIYHEFTVSSDNKEFDVVLNSKPCTDDFFYVDISNMSNLIKIEFKIIDRNLKVLTAPEISIAVRKPLKWFIDNPQGGQIEYRSEFNLKCAICQAYCIFSLSTCPVKYYYIDEESDYVCYYCNQFFKLFLETDESSAKKAIPTYIFKTMKFFKWNCSTCCSVIEFSDMQSHEINCKRGRQFSCPIANCCDSAKGIANQMIQHLKNRHNFMAFGSHFKLPRNFLKCYVFFREDIVFLRATDTLDFTSSLDHRSIHAELVIKTDNVEKRPYALFFNTNNEILRDHSKFASDSEVFVKVFVD